MIKPPTLLFGQNEIYENDDDGQLTPLSGKNQEPDLVSKAEMRFNFLDKQKTEGKSNKSIVKFSQNSNIESLSHIEEVLPKKSQQVPSNVSHAANFDKAQSSLNEMSLDKLNDLDMRQLGSVHVYNHASQTMM